MGPLVTTEWLAAELGNAGSSLGGLTLKSELLQDVLKSSKNEESASEAVIRYFVAPFMFVDRN